MLNNHSKLVLADNRVSEALSFFKDVESNNFYENGPLDELKEKLNGVHRLLQFFINLESSPKIDYEKLNNGDDRPIGGAGLDD
jgi:hypothetical protein